MTAKWLAVIKGSASQRPNLKVDGSSLPTADQFNPVDSHLSAEISFLGMIFIVVSWMKKAKLVTFVSG